MRILVVEDQPEIAALMMALVGRSGHETILATSGEEAIVAFKRSRPDLVFMDIGLPDMDGYELTRRLRNRCNLGNVPVWAVTSTPDDVTKRGAVGIVGYMQKPISSGRLERVLGPA